MNSSDYLSLKDPLFHPGWIEFNERKAGLKAERLIIGPDKGTAWELETIVYRNKTGSIINPSRTPYMPMRFHSTSDVISSVNRRKRMAIEKLSILYKNEKINKTIKLSPVLSDIRPFVWEGFTVDQLYTYYLDLNKYPHHTSSDIKNKIRKALKAGYYFEESVDYDAIIECIHAPYKRQRLKHTLFANELSDLHYHMESNGFTAIICKDKDGQPQGAAILFYSPGGIGMNWTRGMKNLALKDGANSLLMDYTINFLKSKGCKVCDLGGANIPRISKAKESWGGELIPYFAVSKFSVKNWSIKKVKKIYQKIRR